VELSVSVPHIVITGGGFGGLAAARALADASIAETITCPALALPGCDRCTQCE
jgi:ribulose 1,5-bisphosphate synthetase/thiazole synthase